MPCNPIEGLGVDTSWGIIEPIQSNDLPVCFICGAHITSKNNSGWELFREDGRTTQKICITCNGKEANSIIKKSE